MILIGDEHDVSLAHQIFFQDCDDTRKSFMLYYPVGLRESEQLQNVEICTKFYNCYEMTNAIALYFCACVY